MSTKGSFAGVCAVAALLFSPLPCAAQATRTGLTFFVGGSGIIRFPDVAHDTINDRYLEVHSNLTIQAQLLDANGAKISTFVVNATVGVPGEDAQCPRVVFSKDINNGAGGYLVTWHETFGSFSTVRARLLSTDGTPLTGEIAVSPEATSTIVSTNYGMGPAIAYSPTAKEFLVTWMANWPVGSNDIKFTRLSVTGVV